jgi:2-polyprenyl-3-methyl-5-hydroxy-6-metoxy-1,4-benzoquinol methylase
MDVLEIGCGTGSTALLHAPHVKHIRAIDFSANMVAIAQGKAAAQHIDNVTFERATIEELAIPAQSFDVVLGLSILHLLKDKERVIAQVYDLLKPSGVFITSTACLGDRMGWFKLIAPIGRVLGFFPYVAIFSVKDLETSLTHAGFTLDYQWQPSKDQAVFIVAKKPE